MKLSRYIYFVFIWISSIVTTAQSDCPAIVETALSGIDSACADLQRNQACFGHIAIETEFQPQTENMTFSNVGDVVDVIAIQSMQLSPLDEANGNWGLAMMKLQANIPDSVPGQNVTMLLFGDVELTNNDEFVDANPNPMQAFYLNTGIGDSDCTEAPESGVLIQTPDGVKEVTFNINGVDVAMGSTVLFQTQADEAMSISVLEGTALVNLDGQISTILDGTQLQLGLTADLLVDEIIALDAYTTELIQSLPIDQLQREIDIAIPRVQEEIEDLQRRLDEGLLLCDGESLPDCEDLPLDSIINGLSCLQEGGSCRDALDQLEELGIDIDLPDGLPSIDVDINIPDVEIPDVDVPGIDLNLPGTD